MKDVIKEIPLFPLNSIILPGGRIPLQLFEPRYLDMLTRCLKEDRGFVVVLLREGGEATQKSEFHDIGTYVRIIDFQQLDNGLLGITAEGDLKVRVLRSWQQSDGLNLGDAELLAPEEGVQVPAHLHELSTVLRALCRHPVIDDLGMQVNYQDARDVGWRLTELLPLEPHQKQHLAELQSPLERLEHLQALLETLDGS